ncbi:ER lumen protein retaining receptor [Carpediemonas membranifera]|uniref:ER lumen protein retaining receptor n=1 Tax=Carpediemonas membranifera TaxID=201153 RepID=A0A8J6E3M8_9EUKA|nr:ER lumen protein retaining receptor [Carpediemonas membranifera]|eukprot:KAG9395801.1 ER lumen protein retaining receptor [Carpediemonas membranifera]
MSANIRQDVSARYNPFRFLGDAMHLLSMIILLQKLYRTKNCTGVSLKTKILYLLVFCMRYMDLFWNWTSLYNNSMKILYIGLTATTIYLILGPLINTYDRENDTFRLLFAIVPSCVIGFLVAIPRTFFYKGSLSFRPFEVVWASSIWLECVAILPQLFLLARTSEIESFTSSYIACLGGYRAIYILNWIYRFFHHQNRLWYVYLCGIIQTALYADFFYYFFKAKLTKTRMKLPQ